MINSKEFNEILKRDTFLMKMDILYNDGLACPETSCRNNTASKFISNSRE